MSVLAYKMPGFAGRFVSQTGRRANLRDVGPGDVVEVWSSGARVRVVGTVTLPLNRIALLDGKGTKILEGRETEKVRVWSPAS